MADQSLRERWQSESSYPDRCASCSGENFTYEKCSMDLTTELAEIEKAAMKLVVGLEGYDKQWAHGYRKGVKAVLALMGRL